MATSRRGKANAAKINSSKQKATGSIRIIAGKHRGRKLPVLDAQGLRPTTDRVKETVFNWLMPYIQQAHCLDCFAGSGGLGFEAISRGATQVTFIELNKQAAQQLQQNIALLKENNNRVEHTNCLTFLQQTNKTPFDVVFLDPPFRQNLLPAVVDELSQGWLADNALIYVETESDFQVQLLPKQWRLLKEKTAGQVSYRLYQYITQ